MYRWTTVNNNGIFGKKKESVTGQCTAEVEPESLTKDSLMISSTGFSLRNFGAHIFSRDAVPSSVVWIKARGYSHPRTLEDWGWEERGWEERGRWRKYIIAVFSYRKGCQREKYEYFFLTFLIMRTRNYYLKLQQDYKEVSQENAEARPRRSTFAWWSCGTVVANPG